MTVAHNGPHGSIAGVTTRTRRGAGPALSGLRIGSLARWLTAAALAAAAAGCGESRPEVGVATYPVQGKVVLANGQPLTSGVVVFVSGGSTTPPVSGVLGPDGSFVLMTDGVVAGAPAGEYKVRLEIDPDASATGTSPRKRNAVPFPAKYGKETTSGLTATVKAEPANELRPFVLN
ncbi:hypothetical protein [Paludisphaera mucosa]|uniref:Carboxypeptidase regulatory-like domain-containing protein n=1 Tax=Paludisphaera mucosa TaxID=3030827 RepID=A0ABT6FHL2_9BACT|nr:hypothetical protein [Paludisphaera mucosa]MDG3006880.1 hypothetical protein [Paludisphaera mucosa]